MSDQMNALNLIVSTTEQSGNIKKGLKQTIFETVSTLRNPFVKLMDSRDSKIIDVSKLEMEVIKLQAELSAAASMPRNTECHLLPTVKKQLT